MPNFRRLSDRSFPPRRNFTVHAGSDTARMSRVPGEDSISWVPQQQGVGGDPSLPQQQQQTFPGRAGYSNRRSS